jgi:hypothetical protein
MGLDMYLERAKRIDNVTPEQLININEYFSYLERPEKYKNDTMEDWCGISIDEIDMSLVEKYKNEYIHRFASWDHDKKYGWRTIIETVGDWRKANHIHQWFVNNVQDGEDDCGHYEVTKEQLKELLDICQEVVDNSHLVQGKIIDGQTYHNGQWRNNYVDGEYIEDYSVAKKLLPTTSGFFFGSTQYDEWYLRAVKYTIQLIQTVLNTTDFEHELVVYTSSW